MTEQELCRISHYLFILDTYLFEQEGREDQQKEIAHLQKRITEVLREMEEVKP